MSHARLAVAVVATAFFVAACEPAPTQPSLTAVSAFAKANTTKQNLKVPLSGSITNDCTGEVIVYDGVAHEVITTTTVGDQQTTYVHINLEDFHGVGDTGASYVIQEIAKESADQTLAPPFPYTIAIRLKLKLTSQGSGDNSSFTATQYQTYDGTTYTVTLDSKTTCNG